MAWHTFKVTTTGSAGSATGSTDTFDFPLSMIDAIEVDYHASAPATTDVVVAEAQGLEQTVLSVADNKTDGTYYPRHALHDADGAELSSVGAFVVEGPLTISVAGCDALTDAVTVRIKTVRNKDAN